MISIESAYQKENSKSVVWNLFLSKIIALKIALFISGVEKKNDDLRKIFHRKTNRKDALKTMMKVEKRTSELEENGFKRQQREYSRHEEW